MSVHPSKSVVPCCNKTSQSSQRNKLGMPPRLILSSPPTIAASRPGNDPSKAVSRSYLLLSLHLEIFIYFFFPCSVFIFSCTFLYYSCSVISTFLLLLLPPSPPTVLVLCTSEHGVHCASKTSSLVHDGPSFFGVDIVPKTDRKT
jgi:hypothetical protein